MKKFIFNEWTFTFSILGFIFMCFISTRFGIHDVPSLIINVFASMLLLSLVLVTLSRDLISNRLKTIIYGFFLIMLIVSMSSCGTTKYGCPDTRYMTGYR